MGMARADFGAVADTMLDVVLDSAVVPTPDISADAGEDRAEGDRGGVLPELAPGAGLPPPLVGVSSLPVSGDSWSAWPDAQETMTYSQYMEGGGVEASSKAEAPGYSE
eukprot:s9634_g1.t1